VAISSTPVHQTHAFVNNAASVIVPLVATPTATNTLLAAITTSGSVTTQSIMKTLGGSHWIQVAYSSTPTGGCELWMDRGVHGTSASVTLTFTGAASVNVNISEWSGILTASPVDQWSQNFGTSASITPQTLGPRQNGDLIVTVANSAGSVSGPVGGYTSLGLSAVQGDVAAYSVLSGSVAANMHWNGPTNAGSWTCVEASFLAGSPQLNPDFQFPETMVQISAQQNYLAPLNGTGIWTDVSGYVMNMTLGPLGRQHELDRVQATQATFTMTNITGVFNPWNTNGFLGNGELDPMSPVKVTAAWMGITSPQFYGYLQSVTPVIADVLNTTVTIEAFDILQELSLKYLSNDNYAQDVLSPFIEGDPLAYYRLGETAGGYSVDDATGNGNTGSLISGPGGTPAFGVPGPFLYDPDTALDLTNGTNLPNGGISTNDNSTEPPTTHNPLSSQNNWELTCWFKWVATDLPAPATPASGSSASVAGVPNGVLMHFTSASVTYEVQIGFVEIPTVPSGTTVYNSVIFTDGTNLAFFFNFLGVTPLDGQWHYLQLTNKRTLLPTIPDVIIDNGIPQSFISPSLGNMASPTNITIGTPPIGQTGIDPSGGTLFAQGLPVMIDEVTLGLGEPGFSGVTYNTGTWFQQQEVGAVESSDNDTITARFNKVMQVVGLDPTNMLNVPYEFQTLLYAETNDLTTTSALNYMQTQTETEPGLIFQGPDGVINAYSRQYQYLNQTSIVSQATLSDSSNSPYFYDGPSLQIVGDDLDTWNQIQVQSGRSNSQLQESNSQQSASVYGQRTLQGLTSLQQEYDSDALAISQNYLKWYQNPLTRVVNVTLNSQGNMGSNLVQMLQRQLMDRLTIQYQGQTNSTLFSQDSLIESITHTVDMSQPTWITSYALSPYELIMTPFIFGNNAQSQLGGAASVTGSGTTRVMHPAATNYLSGTVVMIVASGASATVAYNATAATIQTALAALVPSTTVTGGPLNTSNVSITFGSSQSSFSAVFNPSEVLTL